MLQQTIRMGLVLRRSGVPEYTWHKAQGRVQYHERTQLATGKNVITDGDRLVYEVLSNSMVNAFVSSADQHERIELSPPTSVALRERTSAWREEDAVLNGTNRFNRLRDRLLL